MRSVCSAVCGSVEGKFFTLLLSATRSIAWIRIRFSLMLSIVLSITLSTTLSVVLSIILSIALSIIVSLCVLSESVAHRGNRLSDGVMDGYFPYNNHVASYHSHPLPYSFLLDNLTVHSFFHYDAVSSMIKYR